MYSEVGQIPYAGIQIADRVIRAQALFDNSSVSRSSAATALTVTDIIADWEQNAPRLRAGLAASSRAGDWNSAGIPVGRLRVHAPIMPRQIFCIGGNYRQHLSEVLCAQGMTFAEAQSAIQKMTESGEPYAFVKLPSAVTGPFDEVELPRHVKQPDWELELAVVMGSHARHVHRDDARKYIAGYCIANDITARDFVYRADWPSIRTDWLRGKSSPGFLPLGPHIVPAAQVADPQALSLRLHHNGRLMQDGNTCDMIHSIGRQIEYLSQYCELLPGDLICTGSPAGNGVHHGVFLRPGDVLEGTISGLGIIRNVFKHASP
jgi:2-keto-4-pentenoate hydratase/2-oxohepta-3-ene-1,7-dioic acid hydratase in catechol pathway